MGKLWDTTEKLWSLPCSCYFLLIAELSDFRCNVLYVQSRYPYKPPRDYIWQGYFLAKVMNRNIKHGP